MSDVPDTLTIVLDPPLQADGGVLTELVLREPRAREVRAAEQQLDQALSPASFMVYRTMLIAAVAGVKPEVAARLPIRVINRAMAYIDEFVSPERPVAEDEAAGDPDPWGESLAATISIAVEPPVRFTGIDYASIDLREPSGGEVRAARTHLSGKGNPLFNMRRMQMHLVQVTSGLPMPVVEGLRVTLLEEASAWLGRFIDTGPKTGKRSPGN